MTGGIILLSEPSTARAALSFTGLSRLLEASLLLAVSV
jgi:hypothetical protein